MTDANPQGIRLIVRLWPYTTLYLCFMVTVITLLLVF